MKKLLLILHFLPVFAIAQKQLLINGKISGLKEQSMVFLTDANDAKDTIAKGLVKKGVFELKGSLREPILVSLFFKDAQKRTILFLDNNKITVEGNIDNLQKLTVTGSPSQTDFQAFQDTFNPLFDKYTKASQRMKTEGMTDSLQMQAAKTFTAIQEQVEMFLQHHTASPVSPFLLLVTAQLSDDITVLEKRFNTLEQPAQTNYYGKYLRQMIDDAKIGAVGSDAMDFTQNDAEGKPVSLSSYKGKYVLLDFWASWCGPCRMENPNVVNTYAQFKDKNFTVLGVSLDKAKNPWLKAINDDKLTWTHVSDLKFWNNEIAVKYHIQSIPQNFLIDPSGKIIAKNLRGPALKEKLCQLLGCN
ncbi:MAG: TlpA disulfide reductase family protein [Chitinophagaceae bacterium]